MAGTRYREITRTAFTDQMAAMGFGEVVVRGCAEHVYERQIDKGPNPNRFAIRIFSSVHRGTGVTRECGGDAIRVLLMDTVLDRPVLDWRVYRTESALENTKTRAREAWVYVAKAPENHCSCGALMVERTSKHGPFMGCTNYPICRNKRRLVAEPVKQAA